MFFFFCFVLCVWWLKLDSYVGDTWYLFLILFICVDYVLHLRQYDNKLDFNLNLNLNQTLYNYRGLICLFSLILKLWHLIFLLLLKSFRQHHNHHRHCHRIRPRCHHHRHNHHRLSRRCNLRYYDYITANVEAKAYIYMYIHIYIYTTTFNSTH